MLNDRKTTNLLLLAIVIPLFFYLLKILSFIFIPLVSSMFIALLFLPLMRWFKRKGVPKFVSITVVILIIIAAFRIGGGLIKLSSAEILATDNAYFDKAKVKISSLLYSLGNFVGLDFLKSMETPQDLVSKDAIMKSLAPTVDFISSTISMILSTLFFVLLLLAESMDVQKIMNSTILKKQFASVKTFMKIERDLIKFIKVKFFISLFTGIGIGIACWAFGVSFPIFWGVFAFAINFLQLVGSVITVVLLAVFAFVEIESSSILLFFVLTCTGVQVLFGGILEPVFMGRSFSINVVTILVMLMLWGNIWGIAGLIMSIPITVFLKIIMEQYKSTRVIAQLISGNTVAIVLPPINKKQIKT
ncbi:AI-2E family transporter [Roseivirga pacifica]|uniref:AI-2E family transporter n=1 Tax=Roseivirga pacifica TaxID=1267423 RepID=UPI002095C210|nr:AI-2E family transporter [Roseivirga pacifica]